MNYLALLFSGALLCNAIPHLAAGLMGTPFPTPFAKPRGVGNSSPLLNFLWGAFNVVVGLALLARFPAVLGANFECLAMLAGALASGIYLSRHFGRVGENRRLSA